MPNRNDWIGVDVIGGILIALAVTGAAVAVLTLIMVCTGLLWAIAHIVRAIF